MVSRFCLRPISFEVGLTQNPVDHEKLYIAFHVRLHVGLFIHLDFLGPLGP